MSNKAPLTRICAACGLEKPLAAFLQVTSTHGTTYGSICGACRSAGRTVPSGQKEIDKEGRSGPSGHQIGTKELIHADKEKKRQLKDLKELYRKEDVKRREETKEKTARVKDLKEKAQKDHRKSFIETKKEFLTKSLPSSIEEAKKRLPPLSPRDLEAEAVRQEEIIRQELQIASWGMATTFLDPHAPEAKYQSEVFLRFRDWLGASAPISRTLQQLYGNKPAVSQLKAENPASKKTEPPIQPKQSIEDYIDKRLGVTPSSRKR